MDPLSIMLMAAKASEGAESGAPQQMLQPSGSLPQPQPMGPQNPMTAASANPMPQGQQQGGLQSMMSGIQAPKGTEPKFSGGVSGSGLPYVGRIEDMVSPFLQASGANKPQMLPTLGMLISQAPGGGR